MHSASPRCTKSTSKLQDTALTVLGSLASFSSYVQRPPLRQYVLFENQATLYGPKLGEYRTEAIDLFILRCIQAHHCQKQLERGAKSSKQAKASRLRDRGLSVCLFGACGSAGDMVMTAHSKEYGNTPRRFGCIRLRSSMCLSDTRNRNRFTRNIRWDCQNDKCMINLDSDHALGFCHTLCELVTIPHTSTRLSKWSEKRRCETM